MKVIVILRSNWTNFPSLGSVTGYQTHCEVVCFKCGAHVNDWITFRFWEHVACEHERQTEYMLNLLRRLSSSNQGGRLKKRKKTG